jgi:peptide/nickel transport system permease protein
MSAKAVTPETMSPHHRHSSRSASALWAARLREARRYLGRNPSLSVGLAMIGFLLAFIILGQFLVSWDAAFPLSGPSSAPPSWDYPFGTDLRGRDLFAVMVYGSLLTLKIGLIAGVVGIAAGALVAFVAAYHGGWLDAVLRVIVDVLITVPSLLVLVVLASALQKSMSTNIMAFTIALLAWREPARKIRAQVLVMREAPYVAVARLNGASALRIIFLEMMPNLLPYLCASLVMAIAWAVLASIGLEALGLGAPSEPTLGMTIYWLMNDSAFLLGMWWWIVAPITFLIVLFVGLYLITAGLDELANPRLRVRA